MTTYLENMSLGDKILVNGPIERLQYYGNGLVRTGEKGPYDIVKKVREFINIHQTFLTSHLEAFSICSWRKWDHSLLQDYQGRSRERRSNKVHSYLQ